jgi:putative acetyltransferase
MIIRRYQDSDLESVATLFTETVSHVNVRECSPAQITAWTPQPPDLIRWRERVASLTLWVAESDSRIVGFCGLGEGGHVDLLYVDYRFQRQGVARQLYEQVEKEARRCNIRRLFTEASTTARPFFERMGFIILRAQQVEFRDVLFQNYVMEKRLFPENK